MKDIGLLCRSNGKEFTCDSGDQVQSLGWEVPLERGMAAHSSILAWRIPCCSPWGHKESDAIELYSIILVSVEHQYESAIDLPESPPSNLFPTSLPIPPLSVVTQFWFEFAESHGKFPMAVSFTRGNVYSMSLSPCIPPPPYPLTRVHKSVLYVCVSIAAYRLFHQYHLPRFHIFALVYNTCFSPFYLLTSNKIPFKKYLFGCTGS